MDDVIVSSDDTRKQFHESLPAPSDRIEQPLVATSTINSERRVLDGSPDDREGLQISVSRDVTTDDWIINLSYHESDHLMNGRQQRVRAWVIERDPGDREFTIERQTPSNLLKRGEYRDPAEFLRNLYADVLDRVQ